MNTNTEIDAESDDLTACGGGEHSKEHSGRAHPLSDPDTLARAAEIFRAAGDPARLRVLDLLRGGEQCVSEILEATAVKPSTLSQQLRLLRMEDLIVSRRQGKHLFYSLADQHISDLLQNVLAHAAGNCGLTHVHNNTQTHVHNNTQTNEGN